MRAIPRCPIFGVVERQATRYPMDTRVSIGLGSRYSAIEPSVRSGQTPVHPELGPRVATRQGTTPLASPSALSYVGNEMGQRAVESGFRDSALAPIRLRSPPRPWIARAIPPSLRTRPSTLPRICMRWPGYSRTPSPWWFPRGERRAAASATATSPIDSLTKTATRSPGDCTPPELGQNPRRGHGPARPRLLRLDFRALQGGRGPDHDRPWHRPEEPGTVLARSPPVVFIGIPRALLARKLLGWGRDSGAQSDPGGTRAGLVSRHDP